MSALTLYHALFSTCSQKVRYVLAKKGLGYSSRLMDFSRAEQLEDWYLAINPNGVVPALTHKGHHVVDSSVICEYLDEVFSPAALSPEDPVGRAQMRAWMRYFEEVPTAAIRAPSFNTLFVEKINQIPEEESRRRQDKMPLRKHFYRKLDREGFSDEVISESTDRLNACLDRVERALKEGGAFLLGKQMTLADIVLLPSVVRMEDLGMNTAWSNRPGVANWYQLMQDDPAFDITYEPGSRFNVT